MSQQRSKLAHATLALVLAVISAVLWPSLSAPVAYANCTPNNSVCITNNPTVTTTLNGHDQPLSYNLDFTLEVDSNTTGWNVQISSTQFMNSGGTHTLPTTASSVTGAPTATEAMCPGGDCTDPTNTIHYPVSIPAGDSPMPNKFYNAASGTGIGTFTVTAPVDVVIPGDAYAGTYTSTITIALTEGP